MKQDLRGKTGVIYLLVSKLVKPSVSSCKAVSWPCKASR